MKISGFTIARNAVQFGYPLQESIRSLLPLVDELWVAVGDCEDGTWELIHSIGDSKIQAFRTVWDPQLRADGLILSQQTNLALQRCSGDWGVYLQADEVLHENDLPILRQAMQQHLNQPTEALSFRYLHFYGSYQTVQDHARKWYQRAVRAVKLGIGAESWGDAMGFRLRQGGQVRDLKSAPSGAWVYHYGWARPPEVMIEKQKNLDRFYHDEAWIQERYKDQDKKVSQFYKDLGDLKFFTGTHPQVMQARVAGQDWQFDHGIQKQPPDAWRHFYNFAFYRLEIRLKRVWNWLRGRKKED